MLLEKSKRKNTLDPVSQNDVRDAWCVIRDANNKWKQDAIVVEDQVG